MPIVARKFKKLPSSAFCSGRLQSVSVSGLRYCPVMSGKRNPSKHEWRGYVSRGAVKANLSKNSNTYEGLPVPSTLISACPALSNGLREFGKPSGPCYALAVNSLENTSLFVAIPIDPCSNASLDRALDRTTSLKNVSISDDPGDRSIDIGMLHILRLPVRIRKDQHGPNAFIRSSLLSIDVTPTRDAAITKIKLPREVSYADPEDVPNLGLAEPYFSVFFDDNGLLLFFVEHPSEEDLLPPPEGIVEAEGFQWVRRLQLKSLRNLSAKDIEFLHNRPAAVAEESVAEDSQRQSRPEYPNTMDEWLRDSHPTREKE